MIFHIFTWNLRLFPFSPITPRDLSFFPVHFPVMLLQMILYLEPFVANTTARAEFTVQ